MARCPHCGTHLDEDDLEEILGDSDDAATVAAAALANQRRKFKGGRPRTDAPRCPCGKSTWKRAEIRKFDCCRKAGVSVPQKEN